MGSPDSVAGVWNPGDAAVGASTLDDEDLSGGALGSCSSTNDCFDGLGGNRSDTTQGTGTDVCDEARPVLDAREETPAAQKIPRARTWPPLSDASESTSAPTSPLSPSMDPALEPFPVRLARFGKNLATDCGK